MCNRYWHEFNNFQFQLISHQVCKSFSFFYPWLNSYIPPTMGKFILAFFIFYIFCFMTMTWACLFDCQRTIGSNYKHDYIVAALSTSVLEPGTNREENRTRNAVLN